MVRKCVLVFALAGVSLMTSCSNNATQPAAVYDSDGKTTALFKSTYYCRLEGSLFNGQIDNYFTVYGGSFVPDVNNWPSWAYSLDGIDDYMVIDLDESIIS